MDDFENAFGSAFNDSGTNKVVEDSQKKEVFYNIILGGFLR